jgi:uncharacterized protein
MSDNQHFAMITGASSGIGVAYAKRLSRRGYNLILVARRRDRLEGLAKQIRLETHRAVEVVVADLANAKDLSHVESLLIGRDDIDALINNAGLGALGPTSSVSPDALENLIKINILALTRLTQAALSGFVPRNRGTIVNIASVLAVLPSSPGGASYSGSKAYVLNFSRSLQMELSKTKVVLQVVLPGPVRTEFFEASGLTKAPFPGELFMSADELVDTALTALDQVELVCLPSLQDISSWITFEEARRKFSGDLMQSGKPAARYQPTSSGTP